MLPRALRKLDLFDLLILDDIGYVQQAPEEVEVLFTLMGVGSSVLPRDGTSLVRLGRPEVHGSVKFQLRLQSGSSE
jgi:hypothetical protein